MDAIGGRVKAGHSTNQEKQKTTFSFKGEEKEQERAEKRRERAHRDLVKLGFELEMVDGFVPLERWPQMRKVVAI